MLVQNFDEAIGMAFDSDTEKWFVADFGGAIWTFSKSGGTRPSCLRTRSEPLRESSWYETIEAVAKHVCIREAVKLTSSCYLNSYLVCLEPDPAMMHTVQTAPGSNASELAGTLEFIHKWQRMCTHHCSVQLSLVLAQYGTGPWLQ